MNAIPLKFKYADAELVSGLIKGALRNSTWLSTLVTDIGDLRDLAAQELNHDICLSLVQAGCVVIQLDEPASDVESTPTDGEPDEQQL